MGLGLTNLSDGLSDRAEDDDDGRGQEHALPAELFEARYHETCTVTVIPPPRSMQALTPDMVRAAVSIATGLVGEDTKGTPFPYSASPSLDQARAGLCRY